DGRWLIGVSDFQRSRKWILAPRRHQRDSNRSGRSRRRHNSFSARLRFSRLGWLAAQIGLLRLKQLQKSFLAQEWPTFLRRPLLLVPQTRESGRVSAHFWPTRVRRKLIRRCS